MIGRTRRVLRDRAAGLVFDWRRGHGSLTRQVIAAVVSVALCGLVYAYVQLDLPRPLTLAPRGQGVTVMDIESPENVWFVRLIEERAPLEAAWPVRDDKALEEELARAMATLTPARYVPDLAPIITENEVPSLPSLPGAWALPIPEPVAWPRVARRKAKWWIDFVALEQEWGDFATPWDEDGALISAGETWSFLVGLNPAGGVETVLVLEGKDDPRSQILQERLKTAPFPEAAGMRGALRWWKVVATAENRNAQPEEDRPQ